MLKIIDLPQMLVTLFEQLITLGPKLRNVVGRLRELRLRVIALGTQSSVLFKELSNRVRRDGILHDHAMLYDPQVSGTDERCESEASTQRRHAGR